MRKIFFILIMFGNTLLAQNVMIEGYAFESNNRGFLNEVKIIILDKNTKALRGETFSNMEGFFNLELPVGRDFILRAEKKVFHNNEQTFTTKGKSAGDKVYLKVELERKPGYLFDVTMSERRLKDEPVDAISGAWIEVYNNTTKKEELVLKDYEHPNFGFTFEQGSHYTIMIRKKGFFNKRMEAYVNVEGCILCFDGVGDVRPGVSDVMTKNNTMGTLLANVELDRIKLNKSIKIENIYYDLAKWEIRSDAAEELDKLLVTLKDNPSLIVELGSHTDSRGNDDYNQDLSQKRAQSAVDYLVENGIDSTRITAKGYGESKLVNSCGNGVQCSERRHQMNRRTELKVTGFMDNDPYAKLSLKDILEEEAFQKMLQEVQNQEVIQIKEGESLPPEIQKNQKSQKQTPSKTKKEESKKIETSKSEIKEIPESKPHLEEKKEEKMMLDLEVNPTTSTSDSNSKKVSERKIFSGKDIDGLKQKQQKVEKPTKKVEEVDFAKVRIELEEPAPNKKEFVVPLSRKYSGYKVEVLSSMSPLGKSHHLFSKYQNLILEEKKDGTFAYLLGDFENKLDAGNFLKTKIQKDFPKAKIVQFVEGRRVKM